MPTGIRITQPVRLPLESLCAESESNQQARPRETAIARSHKISLHVARLNNRLMRGRCSELKRKRLNDQGFDEEMQQEI